VFGACETSPEDRVTLMVCVAVNGFHPSAEYQWSCTGKIMENERTPLLYTANIGHFQCYVTAGKLKASRDFEVTGKLLHFIPLPEY